MPDRLDRVQVVTAFGGVTLSEADECLRQVLADEPNWIDTVGLVRLDFSGVSPKVEVVG